MNPQPSFSPSSSAGTVAPRCSSSRPSRVGNRFVLHRHRESQHDQTLLFSRCFRSSSTNIDSGRLCPTLREPAYCIRAWANNPLSRQHRYASHRHPSPSAGPVVTYGSTANNQIPIAAQPAAGCSGASRGFLPRGLSDACPRTASGHRASATEGRHQTTLNKQRPSRPGADYGSS